MNISDQAVPINTESKPNQLITQALNNLRKLFPKKTIEQLAWETYLSRDQTK
jgi:hypothetical protein